MSFTICTWLENASEQLQKNSTTPKLDAEILLMHVLKINKVVLFTHPDQIISENALKTLNDYLIKRLTGMPIAYILGEKEFWSLSFNVTPDVLIPRPETEHLIEITLKLLDPKKNHRILELGTGSGAIAIALAKERPQWQILACDNSLAALAIAQENALRLLSPNQVTLSFCLSNWFENIPKEAFSAIISNPPYIANDDCHLKDLKHEPITALISGSDGLDDIRKIITQSPTYLESGGILLLEHGHDQRQSIQQIFQETNFSGITTYTDLAGYDRITMGYKKGYKKV